MDLLLLEQATEDYSPDVAMKTWNSMKRGMFNTDRLENSRGTVYSFVMLSDPQ